MSRSVLLWFLIFSALLLVTAARPGYAQATGSISGRVEDSSGAAVSGAIVTIKTLETGATRVIVTDDTGRFRAVSLPLGPQELKAEKAGFKAAVQRGINLAVGQEAVVDLRLEVGDIAEQVTVSAEAPVVNTTTAPVSGLVNEREVKDLPLNGRSFDNLITLNPGAINYGLKSPQTSTSYGNTFTVAGRRPLENLVLLNGIEYTGASQLAVTPGGVSGYLLGIDAVREFNVLTDTYGAEYGKRAGAQVIVVTRSGSNALHGSVFEFLRNSALDARNFFDYPVGMRIPPFRRNQFGAALGGPLKKDKLFLFGNYEGFRQSLAVSNVSVVPDQQARQGLLPCNAITPPLTIPCPASGYAPVPGLHSGMLAYMPFWPQANGRELLVSGLPSGTALAYNNPKQTAREDFGTLRSDYTLSDRDSLSASFMLDDGNSLIPLADPLFASAVALRSQVASFEETHVFSPHMLNTFRAGFSRAAFNYESAPLASFPPSLSFVTGLGPGGIVIGGGATTTGVAAITGAGPSNNANVWNRRNLFTYTDNFQISKGRHQMSTGIWFQRLQDNEDTASRQLGQASFASLQTFLQGTTTNFQAVPNPTELGWRSFYGAWYFEDSIKLRSNLTLQAGLRHEFTTGWNEVAGRAANYLTDARGVLITNPRIGTSAFTHNNAKRLFAPRIALAWDPFGNGKTAIRAGFGTYYTLIDALSFLLNSLPPYNGSLSFSGPLSQILPILPGVPPPPGSIFAPQGVQADAKTPTVQEWNFAVEHQLDANTSLRVAYVGSFAYHELLSVDPNAIPAQICSSGAGCISGGLGSARGSVSQGAEYIPVVSSRPNPNLSAAFFWYSEGNSSYNALQLDMTRRLSKGLQLRANYTWSKSLDMNSGLTGAQANNQAQMILDRNNLRRDWGPSALNATHQSSISALYELPFGQGKHWLGSTRGPAGKFIGGWQVNGIVTLLSGFPFTPQVGSNRSGDGDTRNPDRPSLNPSFTGPVLLQNPNQWFNPNAFVLPTPGTYGNLGRGTFTGPGLAELDLSLFKTTAVSEKATVQFRAEFFNLLNRANFATPNQIVFANGIISSSAGLVTATATMSRQIQFGMKLIF